VTVSGPPDWEIVPFKSVISHSAFGPRFSGDLYSDSGNVATLRTTDLSPHGEIAYASMPFARIDENRFASHFLRKGDLVISRSGRIGTAAVFESFDVPVLPGAFLIRFRLTEDVEPTFYRYFFNSRIGRPVILSVARGVAQQNINISNVELLNVPRPPKRVQQAIVETLSAYDDLIENNRKRIALLEEAARLLYREWFVDLRFPSHEHVKIADGIPEGWERGAVGTLLELRYGKALKESDRIAGLFPVYGSSGVVGTHKNALVEGPAIVVGRKGNVGSVFWSPCAFWPIDTVYYVPKEQSDFWLYLTLPSVGFQNTDAGVPGLNRDFAYSRKCLVPSRPLRRLFEETVEPMFAQIRTLENFNHKLAEARDLLLPRLMNGEIAV
jgi:type I restriction enzyme, S subunit